MILDEINRRTREDLEKRKKEYSIDWLGRSLSANPYPPRDVKPYLTSTKEEPIRIIAEVKKASPSKGVIKEDFDPVLIASEYSKNGANAISVLTEPHYFQGNLEYLTQIRRYVPTPLLRKDFILDKYQIVEALVYGADFILLIAKALGTKEMKELYEYARFLEGLMKEQDEDEDAEKMSDLSALQTESLEGAGPEPEPKELASADMNIGMPEDEEDDMDKEQDELNADELKDLIEGLLRLGMDVKVIKEYIDKYSH